jgi:hypothetical protein
MLLFHSKFKNILLPQVHSKVYKYWLPRKLKVLHKSKEPPNIGTYYVPMSINFGFRVGFKFGFRFGSWFNWLQVNQPLGGMKTKIKIETNILLSNQNWKLLANQHFFSFVAKVS